MGPLKLVSELESIYKSLREKIDTLETHLRYRTSAPIAPTLIPKWFADYNKQKQHIEEIRTKLQIERLFLSGMPSASNATYIHLTAEYQVYLEKLEEETQRIEKRLSKSVSEEVRALVSNQ